MKNLNVAVWGIGRHANNRILPALRSVKGLSLIGICSRNRETVLKCSQHWDCYGWTCAEDMLGNSMIDIIYISTPIGLHAEQIKLTLNAGKHAWCEKPLTCNKEDTLSIIRLAKLKDLTLAEGFMYLYHPQFARAVQFVSQREAGNVRSVICRFGLPLLDQPGFRYNPELCGGALWDVGSYTISLILGLFPLQTGKVINADIYTRDNFKVDIGGRALIQFSDIINTYLEWGIGLGYKNELDIWSDEGSFFTEMIFSKPEGYQPIYRIRDKNGNESLEYGQTIDQFIEMFSYFRTVATQSKLAESEFNMILRRAKLMDDIVTNAKRYYP